MKKEWIGKPTTRIPGELEIDHERGVIYFHTEDEEISLKYGGVTILRICGLPKLRESAIDITLLKNAATRVTNRGYLVQN